MFRKIKYCFFGTFFFFVFLTNSNAASYKVKSFNFLSNTDNINYATIGLYENETRTGKFGLYVSDVTEAKPYANFYIATGNAMLPETFSSNDMTFMIQKTNSKYNYGGYMLDVYVVQVNLLTAWNCSAQGLNCTWSSTFSMKNFYNYQTPSRVFSVTTTDERMNPSADVNVNVNLDGVINQQQQTNNKLDSTNKHLSDINDTLNDDTPPSSDVSSLGNVQGLLKPGPVDSLLNVPTQFLSVVVSSLGGQCKPLSGTWVYDQPLTFPCFDEIIWKDLKDKTLMNFLELIPCAFILIKYFKCLYKKVERATSMETNSDDEWGVI